MKDDDVEHSINNTSSDLSSCICRICQTAKSKEQLISPCNCKGTLGKVHLSCLEKWLNFCGRQYCEICKYHFQVKKTRRYGIAQSLRIWVRHPRHRIHLRSDLIIGFILTLITVALCCICAFGVRYFISEGVKLGIPAVYSEGVILIFMAIIVLGYSVTIYLMCKDHVVPWYRWWSRSLVIKIILIESSGRREVIETKSKTKIKGLLSHLSHKELSSTCNVSESTPQTPVGPQVVPVAV
uniref:E3 ubiquitin-protein ligase MARCH3 n=1 Tax=Lygus hesperus TaxID=30085 RepID=A0A0A9W913_LYGHE